MRELHRVPGWRGRFNKVIQDELSKKFEWGSNDCALFGAACIKAITTEDFSSSFEGKYTTALGAVRTIKENGYKDLEDLLITELPEIHISKGQIGDLVLVRSTDDPNSPLAVGVIIGERIGIISLGGFATMTRGNAVRTFKVG